MEVQGLGPHGFRIGLGLTPGTQHLQGDSRGWSLPCSRTCSVSHHPGQQFSNSNPISLSATLAVCHLKEQCLDVMFSLNQFT